MVLRGVYMMLWESKITIKLEQNKLDQSFFGGYVSYKENSQGMETF